MQPADLTDQAAGLRRLLGEQEAFCSVGIFGPDVVLTASATAGLAFALARRCSHVCVFDELPAPQHVAAHLGVAAVAPGLGDVAMGTVTLPTALLTGPAGVRILGAGGALGRIAAMSETAWRGMVAAFQETACEWLLITAPAEDKASLALACPQRLLVMPATKNRLPETYAVLKAAHQRQPDGRWRVLVMDAADADQAQPLMAALNETAERFLGIRLDYAGVVPRDEKIDRAVRAMRPLLEVSPQAPAAQALRGLAEAMPAWTRDVPVMGREVFWQRLGLFSRMSAAASMRLETQPRRHDRVYG